ncbi:MAG TPA: winged helix-turn-helix transcriptional regulator [Solirubrobacterales bacterium]|nr:winged helix-turn-helix transcriptional regulator [Solirubrobacterales bacterium]
MNVHLLRALEPGPMALIDLRRAVGSPPQSTMRVYSRALVENGTMERQRQAAFPGTVEYASAASGIALMGVGTVLETWLHQSPEGPISLGSTASKSATKALVEGWSSNIIRAIAAKPLSLTDLNRLIPRVSYPSLERRLGALRLANLVEPHKGDGRGTPYRATTWLRQAIVPLTAGAWWEHRYLIDPPIISRLDIEAAFLLAIPSIDLPITLTGTCRLAVEIQGGPSPVFAGVLIVVEAGRIISCSSRLEGEAGGWASGGTTSWMRRMNGTEGDLEIGGDAELAREIIEGIRKNVIAKV